MVLRELEDLGTFQRAAEKKTHNISKFQRHIRQEELKCC